jgi:uncharacterized protein YqfA (UPF0365 family)
MLARVQLAKANVIRAEAEIPVALSNAFRSGKIGI